MIEAEFKKALKENSTRKDFWADLEKSLNDWAEKNNENSFVEEICRLISPSAYINFRLKNEDKRLNSKVNYDIFQGIESDAITTQMHGLTKDFILPLNIPPLSDNAKEASEQIKKAVGLVKQAVNPVRGLRIGGTGGLSPALTQSRESSPSPKPTVVVEETKPKMSEADIKAELETEFKKLLDELSKDDEFWKKLTKSVGKVVLTQQSNMYKLPFPAKDKIEVLKDVIAEQIFDSILPKLKNRPSSIKKSEIQKLTNEFAKNLSINSGSRNEAAQKTAENIVNAVKEAMAPKVALITPDVQSKVVSPSSVSQQVEAEPQNLEQILPKKLKELSEDEGFSKGLTNNIMSYIVDYENRAEKTLKKTIKSYISTKLRAFIFENLSVSERIAKKTETNQIDAFVKKFVNSYKFNDEDCKNVETKVIVDAVKKAMAQYGSAAQDAEKPSLEVEFKDSLIKLSSNDQFFTELLTRLTRRVNSIDDISKDKSKLTIADQIVKDGIIDNISNEVYRAILGDDLLRIWMQSHKEKENEIKTLTTKFVEKNIQINLGSSKTKLDETLKSIVEEVRKVMSEPEKTLMQQVKIESISEPEHKIIANEIPILEEKEQVKQQLFIQPDSFTDDRVKNEDTNISSQNDQSLVTEATETNELETKSKFVDLEQLTKSDEFQEPQKVDSQFESSQVLKSENKEVSENSENKQKIVQEHIVETIVLTQSRRSSQTIDSQQQSEQNKEESKASDDDLLKTEQIIPQQIVIESSPTILKNPQFQTMPPKSDEDSSIILKAQGKDTGVSWDDKKVKVVEFVESKKERYQIDKVNSKDSQTIINGVGENAGVTFRLDEKEVAVLSLSDEDKLAIEQIKDMLELARMVYGEPLVVFSDNAQEQENVKKAAAALKIMSINITDNEEVYEKWLAEAELKRQPTKAEEFNSTITPPKNFAYTSDNSPKSVVNEQKTDPSKSQLNSTSKPGTNSTSRPPLKKPDYKPPNPNDQKKNPVSPKDSPLTRNTKPQTNNTTQNVVQTPKNRSWFG